MGTSAAIELFAGVIAVVGGNGGPCGRGAIAGTRRRRRSGGGSDGGKGFVCGPEPTADGSPLLSSKDVDGVVGGGTSRATSSLTAASATRRFRPQSGQQNLHTGTEWSMRRRGRGRQSTRVGKKVQVSPLFHGMRRKIISTMLCTIGFWNVYVLSLAACLYQRISSVRSPGFDKQPEAC